MSSDYNNNLVNQLQSFPLINPSSLDKLKKSTASNPQYLIEIFKSFVEDSDELINEMKQALNNKDYEQYYNAVHSLKGLAGTIGFTRMFHLLKIMDAHNKDEKFDESANNLETLQYFFTEISEYLNQHFFKA